VVRPDNVGLKGDQVITRLLEFAAETFRGLITRRVRLKSDTIPFLCEDVPRRKILNAVLTESSVYSKPLYPWGWPTHLQIEPSALCNLKCSLCPISSGLNRPQGLMEFETFTEILDEVGDYIFTLLFWGWGEPFLNPRAFDMIAYARAKGVKVVSSTNGHLFAREEFADRLVRSGLDSIIFAIDGVTQSSYARFRQGGNLETVLKAIRTVADRKKALGSRTPLINFRFIVTADNEAEIPLAKQLAPLVGADALTFKTLNPDNDDFYSRLSSEFTGGKALIPEEPRYRRFRAGPRGESRIYRRRNPCKQMWNAPVIHWDGTVVSCSFDPYGLYSLGNLRDGSFWEIWQGEAYRNMRRQFRDNWRQMPRCGDCSYAWEGGSCSHETIAESIFYHTETGNGEK
jgi:radical SAM protein with 4Fe4S-binding SPASM domain